MKDETAFNLTGNNFIYRQRKPGPKLTTLFPLCNCIKLELQLMLSISCSTSYFYKQRELSGFQHFI